LSLKGVNYEWKNPKDHANMTGKQIGFIAQDVEKVFPQWVEKDGEGYKTLTLRGFEALAVESIRELKKENDSLKEANKQLESRLKALEEKIGK